MDVQHKKACSECKNRRERCRAVSVDPDTDEVQYVCPRCWRDLEYDVYMYPKKANHAVIRRSHES